jgi:protein-disulfide isomerase
MKLSRTVPTLALLAACGAPPAPSAPARGAPADAGPVAPAAPTGEAAAPIPITAADPTWGSRQALVTIVEFSDFECPFCGRVQPTLEKLRASYGPEKLRFVWKNEPLPFHPSARPAAEAAMGVLALGGEGAFWKFHDAAFKNQRALDRESYEKWAREAGLSDADLRKLKDGLATGAWADKVDRDHALAASVGVDGTPAFYINGVSLGGAQPLPRFVAVIDEELAKATARVATGTPRDEVYAVMTAENLKNAPKVASDEEDAPDPNVYRVPVGSAPVLGPKEAPVTIVEYSDFQCPFCKRGAETIATVRATYGDKVRVVWKNEPLPFHPRARPAAELALEARAQKGDKGFWAAHDRLFASQPRLEDADLDAVAAALGLDATRARAAIAKETHKDVIEADLDEAEGFHADGTPHYFVNGRRLVGAQPFEVFKAMIDEELGKARALADKGTAPAATYDALTKDGVGPAEPEKITVAPAPNAPSRGSATAKVTVQEFADFECAFCSRVDRTVKELLEAYDGRVKLVWRNVPLVEMHPDAHLAAEAAMEAFAQKGNVAFWKMHDLLLVNQKAGGLKRDALDGYARQIGLDMPRWKAALDGGAHKAGIDAELKTADAAGIGGTPTLVINGYVVRGAQPYAKLRRLVDRALAEAAPPRAAPSPTPAKAPTPPAK